MNTILRKIIRALTLLFRALKDAASLAYRHFPELKASVDSSLPQLIRYADALLVLGTVWVVWPRPMHATAALLLTVLFGLYSGQQGLEVPRFEPRPLTRALCGIGFLIAPWIFQPAFSALCVGAFGGVWICGKRHSLVQRSE